MQSLSIWRHTCPYIPRVGLTKHRPFFAAGHAGAPHGLNATNHICIYAIFTYMYLYRSNRH